MPNTFLYFHGFNSDGNGWKAKALAKHFPSTTILAPDFSANPTEIIRLTKSLLEHIPPNEITLWGSSFGGFFAYYFSAIWGVPAMLINPSLSPHLTLAERGIGHFKTWTKQRDYIFRPDYLPLLAELKKEADEQINPSNLQFFLAEDDDVLDLSKIPQSFPQSDIQWFAHAGHRFSKFEKVLKQMKTRLK